MSESYNDKAIELSSEELYKYIETTIKEKEKTGPKGYTIGFNIGINPEKKIYSSNTLEELNEVMYEWDGYIPLGTRIVYNKWFESGNYFNKGSYYYIDDNTYINEFVEFIGDEDFVSDEDLINTIHVFLEYKLGRNIDGRRKEDIHRLLCNRDGIFYKPTREHSIKDFYNNGSATCIEYAIMGQNILSIFGYNSKLLIVDNHAFQVLEIDGMYYLLDFAKTTGIYNINMELICKIPYFSCIGDLENDWLEKFFNEGEEIRLKEYFIQNVGNSFIKYETNTDRVYSVDIFVDKNNNNKEKNLLDAIYECKDDAELMALAAKTIVYNTKIARKINGDSCIIGANLGISPCENINSDKELVDALNVWVGYVPEGMKIVYQYNDNEDGIKYTNGFYYYLDDDSYIFEFFKYIRNEKVDNMDDFYLYVHEFLDLFLRKNINRIVREDMHQLLYRSDNYNFINPYKEHSIKDFYHNGSAICSEVSVMGSNILSVFGFNIVMVFDRNHAYNVLLDKNGKKYILDFSNYVYVRNIKGEIEYAVPFFEEIKGDDDLITRVINHQEEIRLKEYYYLIINNSFYRVYSSKDDRIYGMGNEVEKEGKKFSL